MNNHHLHRKGSDISLEIQSLERRYRQGFSEITVLQKASLEIKKGEIIALVGPSGAGKSTLLHIVGLLEKPDHGDVVFDGRPCAKLPDTMRTKLRRHHIGFVYQQHNLLADFSAIENVMIPQMITGISSEKAYERAQWMLNKMGLGDRLSHRPMELSGGEQQRVAIARALANRPKVLLADEPTGNLDPHTSDMVFEELLSLVRDTGLTALIATHNPTLANKMDRKVALVDGKLIPLKKSNLTNKPE